MEQMNLNLQCGKPLSDLSLSTSDVNAALFYYKRKRSRLGQILALTVCGRRQSIKALPCGLGWATVPVDPRNSSLNVLTHKSDCYAVVTMIYFLKYYFYFLVHIIKLLLRSRKFGNTQLSTFLCISSKPFPHSLGIFYFENIITIILYV